MFIENIAYSVNRNLCQKLENTDYLGFSYLNFLILINSE